MHILKIPEQQLYDERDSMFYKIPATTLHLEHSLVAISKWEAKWQKPFLDLHTEKTVEEVMDYIRCMCVEPEDEYDPRVWLALSRKDVKEIEDYISNKMTASTVTNHGGKGPQRRAQIITSELLYYYLSAFGIPFDCENWHLARLMMLIQIAAAEQQGGKKMPRNEMISQRNALNKARQAKMRPR